MNILFIVAGGIILFFGVITVSVILVGIYLKYVKKLKLTGEEAERWFDKKVGKFTWELLKPVQLIGSTLLGSIIAAYVFHYRFNLVLIPFIVWFVVIFIVMFVYSIRNFDFFSPIPKEDEW